MNSQSLSLHKKALVLDSADPIANIKQAFSIPEEMVYLDGNSLGALPKAARQRAIEVVDQQWGEDLISSWNKHSWIELPVKVGNSIGALIGAAAGQTICCDSISVNLFKLLSGAMAMQTGRHKIVSQQDNFPTDLYMVQGLEWLLGKQQCNLELVAEEHLEEALNEEVAVLLLTHVNFRSGKIHDMQKITQLAHEKGILVIWDLAHSAGVLELQVDQCDVDFAVGCGYKYLNGGPGAPAFVYIAKRLQAQFKQPLTGWMGHKAPFAFMPDYIPGEGPSQMLAGTPSVIAMSVLDAALGVFDLTTMPAIRIKSLQLGDFFIACLTQLDLFDEFAPASPMNSEDRGSQFALAHPHAFAICQALIARNVIGDFRAPNILRLGFAPLYLSFSDVLKACTQLADIMQHKTYLESQFQSRSKVT